MEIMGLKNTTAVVLGSVVTVGKGTERYDRIPRRRQVSTTLLLKQVAKAVTVNHPGLCHDHC